MKIRSKVIRELRDERGWSQEHLANAADLSVRTVQRIEAQGVASRESTMSLAAAFGVQLSILVDFPDSDPAAVADKKRCSAIRYRAAGVIACICAAIAVSSTIGRGIPIAIAAGATFLTIACALYAGFGWYFQQSHSDISSTRRAARFGFIFLAVFALFYAFSQLPLHSMLIGSGAAVVSCIAYFVIERYVLKRSNGPYWDANV